MASKLRGLNVKEYLQSRKSVRALKLLCGKLCFADLSIRREGQCFEGSNENMHLRKHRDRGSDILGKIIEDNAGKGLLSAGACSNLQRLSVQGNKPRQTEIIGLAHEFVVAMKVG
jgi:hypothetical protein